MKFCPQCKESFDDTVKFCPRDGTELQTDTANLVGRTLDGQYEIEAFIARGGMGSVYRARHAMLGDRVAIKTLRQDMQGNTEWLKRFQREAQAARRFRHPNAVTVYDLRAASDGLIYMVMEYVEGRTLASELHARGRFMPHEAFALLEPVASALDAAHAMGVVHRDLKPENVMLSAAEGGRPVVKLLDLGIAKLQEMAGGEALTVAGQILGTPHYMSPEQWGELPRDGNPEIDGRADLYSLGVMFYALVSGQRPFNGSSLADFRRQHLSVTPPPPHEITPGVPEAFSRAVMRAMAKDRGDRQATVGEFARELRAALSASTTASLSSAETVAMPDAPAASTYADRADTARTAAQPFTATTASGATQSPAASGFAPAPTGAAQQTPPAATQTPLPPPSLSSYAAAQGGASGAAAAWAQPARRSSALPLILVGVLGVFLLAVVGVGGWLAWSRLGAAPAVIENSEPRRGTTTNTTNSGTAGTNGGATTAATIEPLNFWVQAYAHNGRGTDARVAGEAVTLASGQKFQLHFVPRENGYLYIVGPGEDNVPTTLLTAQPVPELSITTNRAAAGEEFHFPGGQQVLELDTRPGIDELMVIFSPAPLSEPAFFAENALRQLSAAEQRELTNFRRRYEANAPTINVQDARGERPTAVVSAPSTAQGQPIIFKITIDHRNAGER